MERLELHDVEYGDCTVLVGRNRAALMVDCGSVSQYARAGEDAMHSRFDAIFARYAAASARHFLLTHYHRDHTNGFFRQTERDPNYFDRVYLPALPQKNPLLEIALLAHCFSPPQSDFSRINTACLTVFERLDKTVGAERIFTLGAGEAFAFDGVFYEILSPGADFPFPKALSDAAEAMNVMLASPRLSEAERDFLREKDAFLRLYDTATAAFRLSDRDTPAARRALLDALADTWARLEALRPALRHSPMAPDICEALDAPLLRTAYSDTLNDLSLVFHNTRPHGASAEDVLLAGDASEAVLDRISAKLFDGYYAVKAPHHGTDSHFPRLLNGMAVAHLLISNGDYHAGGEISQRYIDLECVRHCTNSGACRFLATTGGSCNRLMRCFDQRSPGTLTLRCPAAKGNAKAPCSIYIFSATGVKGCWCDFRC